MEVFPVPLNLPLSLPSSTGVLGGISPGYAEGWVEETVRHKLTVGGVYVLSGRCDECGLPGFPQAKVVRQPLG